MLVIHSPWWTLVYINYTTIVKALIQKVTCSTCVGTNSFTNSLFSNLEIIIPRCHQMSLVMFKIRLTTNTYVLAKIYWKLLDHCHFLFQKTFKNQKPGQTSQDFWPIWNCLGITSGFQTFASVFWTPHIFQFLPSLRK